MALQFDAKISIPDLNPQKEYQSSLEEKFEGLPLGDQWRNFWALQRVRFFASNNAVAIFSMSSCCMCHVAKRLLMEMGVNPAVYELDQLQNGGEEIYEALHRLLGSFQSSVPVVFIGGRLLGGLEQLMTCHISGSLVPLLKQAGALWL